MPQPLSDDDLPIINAYFLNNVYSPVESDIDSETW